jgi:pimeloyl-ACP methyl ester carboxylesterase
MGDRAHLANPGINLDLYITDVVNLLEYEDLHDVILVGWSFGGMTITGVAERVPERLAQVVYLDASESADGDDVGDAELYSAEGRAADAAMGKDAGIPGYIPVDTEFIRALTLDPAAQGWLLEKLVPPPIASYDQPISLGSVAAAALPRAFIFCTEGKGEPEVDATVRTTQRVRSAPGWRYRELAHNHLAPVNDPQATAEVLLSLL